MCHRNRLREVGRILKLFLSPSRQSCSSPFPLAPAPFPWGRLRSSWHFPAVSTVTKLRAMSCPCCVHALRFSNLSASNELWLKISSVDAGHWQVSDPHVIYSIIFLNLKSRILCGNCLLFSTSFWLSERRAFDLPSMPLCPQPRPWSSSECFRSCPSQPPKISQADSAILCVLQLAECHYNQLHRVQNANYAMFLHHKRCTAYMAVLYCIVLCCTDHIAITLRLHMCILQSAHSLKWLQYHTFYFALCPLNHL